MPVFSPEGTNIVFTRRPDSNFHQSPNSKDELWSIEVNGENAHRLDSPPAWYAQISQNADCFTLLTLAEEDWQRNGKFDETVRPTPTPKPSRLLTSDGSFELILDRTGDDSKDYDEQQLGKLYRLRNQQNGEESLVGDWAGFETLWDPLHLRGHENSYFLIWPPLRTVFFFTHLNSTAGDTVHALDLTRKKVIRLSPNWAVPIPIPGEPGFFVESEERYVPLGDGKRTVNCSYLDKSDAEFHKVRYARAAPAIFGGASVWRL